MPRYIIVSASNDYHMPLLADLLQSLRACKTGIAFDIGALDLGLSDANRATINSFGATLKAPGADIDYPGREKWEQQARWFRAMTARPSLPDYFPGYDAYMWIDADAWVQTPDAIETMLPAAAASADLFIASEYDAAYAVARQGALLWDGWFNSYKNCFPPDITAAMCLRPMLNTGVFALSPRAPHWKRWHAILAEALQRIPEISITHMLIEQFALNILVYRENAGAQIIPTEYNWVAASGLPMWDEASRHYVRPMPPHRPLSILHLAAEVKNSSQKIRTVSGRTIERPLTYAAAVAERNKAA